jgi:hypothetical protein
MPHPQKPVRAEQPWTAGALAPQDRHLMPKRYELEFQGGTATKRKDSREARAERTVIMPMTLRPRHSNGFLRSYGLKLVTA